MIIDNDTNIVYFSGLLESDPRFPGSYNRIIEILDRFNVRYDIIKGTRDVWARDYMPVQVDIDKFVQFRYDPSYLKSEPEPRSDTVVVCNMNEIEPVFSNINLDGGNVIRWCDKVLMTDRIYTENPEYTDNNVLVKVISNLLDAEVIIIPQIKSDFTGHADGLTRFLSSDTIIGNDRKTEYKYWVDSMNRLLKKHQLKYIDMPMFSFYDRLHRSSAIGCYMNYLEIGNLIVFPVFEIKGNKDREAVDLMTHLYPEKTIEPVNINDIAGFGGLMNCITWNIKK